MDLVSGIFSKLFHVFTGYCISEYIINRRLSEAAIKLIESENRIIDIALAYQFSSQDSFTKSFTSAHDTSSGKFRKVGKRKVLINPLDIKKLYGCKEALK